MSWPDGECYLRPLQSLVVSLLSLVSTLLFSWTGGILSHQNSLTHRFSQFPSRNLCLSCHARCVLSRLRCNRHSLLLVLISLRLAESRILPAAPADTCPRTLLISFCTVQLRTLCAAHSLATLCLLYDLWSRPWGIAGFWGSMVFTMPPSLGSNQQP